MRNRHYRCLRVHLFFSGLHQRSFRFTSKCFACPRFFQTRKFRLQQLMNPWKQQTKRQSIREIRSENAHCRPSKGKRTAQCPLENSYWSDHPQKKSIADPKQPPAARIVCSPAEDTSVNCACDDRCQEMQSNGHPC